MPKPPQQSNQPHQSKLPYLPKRRLKQPVLPPKLPQKLRPINPKKDGKEDEDASNDDGDMSVASGAGDTKEGTPQKVVAKAPVSGVSYKVQIASLGAAEKYAAAKYDFLKTMGASVETEPGPNGGTRIIANPTNGNADSLMKSLKAANKPCLKVTYKNGVRLTK